MAIFRSNRSVFFIHALRCSSPGGYRVSLTRSSAFLRGPQGRIALRKLAVDPIAQGIEAGSEADLRRPSQVSERAGDITHRVSHVTMTEGGADMRRRRAVSLA